MDHLLHVLCVAGILVVFYSALPAYAANYDETCSSNANCTENNTICNGTNCACSTSSFRNSNSSACVLRKKPGETCEVGQCVVNSICSNATCICNVGYQATPATNSTACSSGVDMVTVNVFLLAFGIVTQPYFPFHRSVY